MITDSRQAKIVTSAQKGFARELEKTAEALHERESLALDEFLSYMLNHFSYPAPLFERFSSEKEQRYGCLLRYLLSALSSIFEEARLGWYDIFGDTYMELSRRDKRLGQFFTPHNICDAMVEVTSTAESAGATACDPCCGSGRMLLAAKAAADQEKRAITLFAADLDLMCVKMTLCNFLLHGASGTVIWGNSLTDETRAVYRTVPPQANFPLPFVVKDTNKKTTT